MREIWQVYKRRMLSLGLLVGLAAATAWLAVAAQVWMSRVINEMGRSSVFLRVLLFYAAVLAIQAAAALAYAVIERLLVFTTTRGLQLALAEKLTAMPYGAFCARPREELFSLWNNDIADLQTTGVSVALTVGSTCFSAVLAAWQLWKIAPLFCLLGVGFALAGVIPIRLLGQKNKQVSQSMRQANIRTNTAFFELFDFAGLIKAYGREDAEIQRFALTNDAYVDKKVGSMMMTRFYKNTVSTLASIAPTVIIVLGAAAMAAGGLSLGSVVLAIALLPTMTAPIGKAGDFWIGFKGLGYKWRALAAVLDTPNEDVPGASAAAADCLPICFENVGYAVGQNSILQNVSFTIQPGQKVAVVGASGSGKTTLAHLALGLLAPTAGRITAGGRALAEHSLRQYYAGLYYAQSAVYIQPGTLRENLLLAGGSEADMRAAVAAVGFDGDIAAMAQGYDTRLTAGGESLSGGQRKKLEIARALCAHRSLYLFDEVTKGIDPDGRKSIMSMLLARAQTMVFITHALEGIEEMDAIVVLQRGQVQGVGTHAQLLESCPYYRQLYEARQAEEV